MVSYFIHIKENAERYEVEKQRVKDILNKKYKEDEEYRLKRREYQKLYRLKKKWNKMILTIKTYYICQEMKSHFKKIKLSSFKYDEIKYKNEPDYKNYILQTLATIKSF